MHDGLVQHVQCCILAMGQVESSLQAVPATLREIDGHDDPAEPAGFEIFTDSQQGNS